MLTCNIVIVIDRLHLIMKARCASTYAIIFVDILLISGTFGQRDCGRQFSLPSDTIESPNYPEPYPANSDCTWIVSVRGSIENIRISFNSFNLQAKAENGECLDYVSVDKSAVEEERYCGSSIPSAIEIGESSFRVHFISDDISSDGNTGFSLFYTTKFKEKGSAADTSGFSRATTGIIAAIFCAVVFIGVGAVRCIMTGACSFCDSSDGRPGHNRQLVGTDASHGFQGDIPPSYSTVMEHPEQYPTSNDNSPRVTVERHGTATDGSSSQTPRRVFTLQSSSSSASDDDDDDDDSNSPPPPPYLDVITSENRNGYNIDRNTDAENTIVDNGPNGANSSLEVVVDDAQL